VGLANRVELGRESPDQMLGVRRVEDICQSYVDRDVCAVWHSREPLTAVNLGDGELWGQREAVASRVWELS
jgi:hypothetical protein